MRYGKSNAFVEKLFSNTGINIRSGKITCCGCTRKKLEFHGETDTRLYQIWENMKQRCTNKNNKDYHIYGTKRMCEEWKNSYIAFRDWSYLHGYNDELTIDRIDNEITKKDTHLKIADGLPELRKEEIEGSIKTTNLVFKEFFG